MRFDAAMSVQAESFIEPAHQDVGVRSPGTVCPVQAVATSLKTAGAAIEWPCTRSQIAARRNLFQENWSKALASRAF
jgi:hypothetical protein